MSERAAVSSERTLTLDFSILGREYRIACREDERAELVEAVEMLDARMREIRDSGKVAGLDRIAVMVALNFAHDLLRARKKLSEPALSAVDGVSAERRIHEMVAAIDNTIAGHETLF